MCFFYVSYNDLQFWNFKIRKKWARKYVDWILIHNAPSWVHLTLLRQWPFVPHILAHFSFRDADVIKVRPGRDQRDRLTVKWDSVFVPFLWWDSVENTQNSGFSFVFWSCRNFTCYNNSPSISQNTWQHTTTTLPTFSASVWERWAKRVKSFEPLLTVF